MIATLWVCNHRKMMLRTDKITQMCYGLSGTKKIAKFSLAVQCGGIPDNVIMNVSLVCVRADNKGVFSF